MPSLKLDDSSIQEMKAFYNEELNKTIQRLEHIKSVLESLGDGAPRIEITVKGSRGSVSGRSPKAEKVISKSRRSKKRPGPVSKWDSIITGILKEKDTPLTYEQLTDEIMIREKRNLAQRKNTKATVTNTVFRLRKEDRLKTFAKGGREKFVALMNWFDGDGSISETYLEKASLSTRKGGKVVPRKKTSTPKMATPEAKARATKSKATAKRTPGKRTTAKK